MVPEEFSGVLDPWKDFLSLPRVELIMVNIRSRRTQNGDSKVRASSSNSYFLTCIKIMMK